VLRRPAHGDIWLGAIGGVLPARFSFTPEKIKLFASALDMLAQEVTPHLWDHGPNLKWQPPSGTPDSRRAALIKISSELITLTTMQLEGDSAPKDAVRAWKNRGAAVRHARKLVEILQDEESPPDLPKWVRALLPGLSSLAALPERPPDKRKNPARGCTPATFRAIHLVCALRQATGGQLEHSRYPFPKKGRAFYNVAAAFLGAGGIKGKSTERMKRDIEKVKANWKMFIV
jgi:hypothetical protein